MENKFLIVHLPPLVKMTRIISVYVIFASLLMSFAGCGKLKDSPVSGLNQTEPFAPSKVNNQSEKVELVKQEEVKKVELVKQEEVKKVEPVKQEEVKKVEPVKPTPLPKLSATPKPPAGEVKVEKKTIKWTNKEKGIGVAFVLAGTAFVGYIIYQSTVKVIWRPDFLKRQIKPVPVVIVRKNVNTG
jgi:outer membrane biosynthesis protein TonB